MRVPMPPGYRTLYRGCSLLEAGPLGRLSSPRAGANQQLLVPPSVRQGSMEDRDEQAELVFGLRKERGREPDRGFDLTG